MQLCEKLVTLFLLHSSLLYDVNFMKQVSSHMVQKLSIADKNSDRAIQLLDGLSVLCACNGAPIKQNQSEYTLLHYEV